MHFSSAKWSKPFLSIGHSGTAAFAAPNTLKSIALALQYGVDMVEFDVRPCRDALVLFHDDYLPHASNGRVLISQCSYAEIRHIDIGEGERIPLAAEAIDLVKGQALMNVDLKDRGCEDQVIELLSQKQVLDDVLISTLIPASLASVKQLAPQVRTSISYPADSLNASSNPFLKPLITPALAFKRWALPYHIAALMTAARADVTTLHFRVISPATVDRVHRRGGKLIAWTVDDLATMRRLKAIGVDGIASNRPDLFKQL